MEPPTLFHERDILEAIFGLKYSEVNWTSFHGIANYVWEENVCETTRAILS